MSARRSVRRTAVVAALACAALAALLAGALPGTGASSRAAGGGPSGEPTPQTDDSVPAKEVTMVGATPAEAGAAADETWGVGKGPSGALVVRYGVGGEDAGEWSLGPALQDQDGQPLSGFELDAPEALGNSTGASPLAGQMTADGAGVLAGYVGEKAVLLVREPNDPSNPFRETDPDAESQLQAGERLLSYTRAPLLAPVDEAGGSAGAFVVPVKEHHEGIEETVLHWAGADKTWTREPIELPSGASSSEFRVLGIGASSPTNAWLLAQLSEGAVALFRRQASGAHASWQAVALQPGGTPGEPLSVEGEQITIPGARKEQVRSQVLTVTEQGVWIDGERPEVRASTTVFFKPAGGGGGGAGAPSLTSWCTLESSPPGTTPCQHSLPQALPSGASRSIAWADGQTPFGERVITGLAEGVSLRLEDESFVPVLALGGSAGSSYGAAFSNPREGWLGNAQLPVHLTLSPAASNLAPWPVSFRHALVAIAPEPDAPVGSLSSEALAVGDLGEVARYVPGDGWLPESLVGPAGHHETPRLRAVAWPAPNRAYAVGDLGEMWLWRGETGLWEPDPGAPRGFDGNLLGVAFDPAEPARGYAVGESGVLLRYGKTWTQETAEGLPAESPCPAQVAQQSTRCSWSNASFSSIAFAGSQAIVAYRLLPQLDTNRYVGGLIVNEGGRWHIDAGAAEALGSNVPWAVAGLPDGSAALGASSAIYERNGPDEPWQATPTPFPGGSEPGSLALFRENGALRVIAAGSVPDTYEVEKAAEAPPGFPAALVKPYPLPSDEEAGVLRQTAGGWRDEQHELNNAKEPPGDWAQYDMVYQPDPVFAVLADPGGAEGWAVGGQVEGEAHGGVFDTAEVERYGGQAAAPVGTGSAPIAVEPTQATFAIAGNAQCAAPCAARADARIGPDVWLSAALERAAIPGVRAFLYTGSRVVSRKAISGPLLAADQFSYTSELGRYASILEGAPLPAFAVASPSDRDDSESELSFEQAFASAPSPFGEGPERAGLTAVSKPPACGAAPDCESAYYTLESSGPAGAVRAIMLDDSGEVNAAQREWVAGQLEAARAAGRPAIIVGNADLNAQIAAGGDPGALALARTLVQGGASAYFFDSPEQNVSEQLRYGGESIPAFGSGTLGYVGYANESSGAFLGASGFLLAQVDVAARNPTTDRAPVSARLVPLIEELALEAQGGTLLRRSQAAQFAALARRPRAGSRTSAGGAPKPETDPYIPIPSNCVGSTCAEGLFPEYSFSSSRPEIGNFVEPNLASAEPNAVLLGSNGKPIPDPSSGLFCAYNAGTTVVTISAGGRSASLPVTVQAGSVRQPCGTEPLAAPLASQAASAPAPAPAPTSAPAAASPTQLLPPPPPPPLPPAPIVAPTPIPAPMHARPTPAPPFVPLSAATAAPLAFVPPPLPTPARPSPPSGTSTVTSPVEVAEKEEEREEATESVANQALAYRADEYEPAPAYLIGLLVIAALAGVSLRRRPRRGRRGAVIAPATISTARAQRRMARTTLSVTGKEPRTHRLERDVT